jgi:hypothetical protein
MDGNKAKMMKKNVRRIGKDKALIMRECDETKL